MTRYYTVYSSHLSMKPDSAHEIHDVFCAQAAANLGYPTTIVYPDNTGYSVDFSRCFNPWRIQEPDRQFQDFFNVGEPLKTVKLPVPSPFQFLKHHRLNYSTLVYKYYLPRFVFPNSAVIHTRDWNCVKAAVRRKIPVIYEKHYFQGTLFEPEIVNSPYLKLAITQSEIIQNSVIEAGMPAEKTTWLYNGFSPSFLERQPEEARQWRRELLKDGRSHLIVYSGALYKFKGIDTLIGAAAALPNLQFALTGGTEEQVTSYRDLARSKEVDNITFLGWVTPGSRLISLLQAADILAHPHNSGKSADFTNPLKFFQYISSGTPIVITEIPPLLPFKDSPLAAVWCEPDNPTALADAIRAALSIYPRKIGGYTENIEYARGFTYEERTKKIIRMGNIDLS